eukprot:CAMPEP_0119131810 /NCGR_PEP_ID=MMETSP1310-20130426/10655_1 /TAXON_ID=464262 /ORGANISM="Genus nov. species nov., Strain RCC2339" /LENGTH=717 /DNA_ID=CAMNT_0007122403 /DNA_START=151 /DNA_END=2304 /DNA_ORIENTATION=+
MESITPTGEDEILLGVNNATKSVAIACKRVVKSASEASADTRSATQDAEREAYLLLMGVLEFENLVARNARPETEKHSKMVADAAEALYRGVMHLNQLAFEVLDTGGNEEMNAELQRSQLQVSERINMVVKATQMVHEDLSDDHTEGGEGVAPVIQSETEAKGLSVTGKKAQRGLAFIFELGKRIAEHISKLPEVHAESSMERILEKALERENLISLFIDLSRKFGRSRQVKDEQQRILEGASRTRGAGTALMAAQKSVISNPGSAEVQKSFQETAAAFAEEVVGLLKTILSVKAARGKNRRDLDIWDEEIEMGKNITFDGKNVKAATLNQLVIRLTDPKTSDHNFVKAFISTFQSFASADELFTKLVSRYNVPRRKFREMDAAEWKKMWVVPTQVKVYNVFKNWIDTRFTDFNYGLVKRLNDFMDNSLRKDGHSRYADRLRVQIKKNIDALQQNAGSHMLRELPGGLSANDYLLDLPTEELANQLTIMEHDIYCKIQPVELLNLAWSSSKLKHRAPNVLNMIDRFNVISGWVTTVLLNTSGLKARAKMYNKLIQLGQACFEMNNYNTLMAVIAGLNCAAVNRLKFTKEEASSKVKATFEDLKAKMSSDASYKSIREILHASEPPTLPYLGVFLTDLTFVEEGNPDKVGGLINFKKRILVYNVLSEIQSYQAERFSLSVDEKAQACLDHIVAVDNDQLYKMSLQREGRNVQKGDLVQ